MSVPWLTNEHLHHAFVRVKENHGCGGADGISLEIFEDALDRRLDELRQSVEDESYYCWPLRRIEVEKHPGSEERRTLLVPAIVDRVLQTAVARYMEPFLEAEFDPCSFAYRRGRSVRMALERVYQLYHQGYIWILDADVDSFFDNADRNLVL